jgi:thiamine-monophosphate kinase
MIRRNGAASGDVVFITGTIGDSAGGLSVLKGEGNSDSLVERYRIPEPPVLFGPKLLGFVSAALDVSDGLLADLAHIGETSGVRIVVEAARIPRSPALQALWGDSVDAIVRAATSGDDYQIAFTAPPSREAEIRRAARDADVAATKIGRVERGAGVVLLDERGGEIAVAKLGFRHF